MKYFTKLLSPNSDLGRIIIINIVNDRYYTYNYICIYLYVINIYIYCDIPHCTAERIIYNDSRRFDFNNIGNLNYYIIIYTLE